jgi:hypothetical protein
LDSHPEGRTLLGSVSEHENDENMCKTKRETVSGGWKNLNTEVLHI